MKLFLIIFLIFGAPTIEEIHFQYLDIQSIPVIDSSIKSIANDVNQANNKVSKRLLKFVNYIHGEGYFCRPVNSKKLNSKEIRISVDKFHFYEIPFQENFLNKNGFKVVDTANGFRYSKWGLNLNKFEAVQSIFQYRYYYGGNRTLSITKIENSPSIQGFIDEWSFLDSNSAKIASIEMGRLQAYVFMNSGAFVCYKDNVMYVFYTNSAGFKNQIKFIFDKFLFDSQAIRTDV